MASSAAGEAPEVAAGSPEPADVPVPPAPPESAAPREAVKEQTATGGGMVLIVGTAAVLALLTVGLWAVGSWPGERNDWSLVVGRGEVIRVPGQETAALVFGDTLYAFPDSATLDRCLGGYPRVRQVSALPPWPRRRLPSVRTHGWLGGKRAVKAEDPGMIEQNVSVGCVLAPVPIRLPLNRFSATSNGTAAPLHPTHCCSACRGPRRRGRSGCGCRER